MKISDIPLNLRPREKALRFGIESLSDQELITLLIGSGGQNNSAIEIATDLLSSYCNSMQALSNTSISSLMEHKGLKEGYALRLMATFEFHHRLNSPKYQKELLISSSEDVYKRYEYLGNLDYEVLFLIMLDSKNRIKQEKQLYKGTFDGFSIDIRQIVQAIILAKAKSFILIHNHPDEESRPSENDILMTKVVKKRAQELGVKLMDHIIIYRGGFYSFIKNKEL